MRYENFNCTSEIPLVCQGRMVWRVCRFLGFLAKLEENTSRKASRMGGKGRTSSLSEHDSVNVVLRIVGQMKLLVEITGESNLKHSNSARYVTIQSYPFALPRLAAWPPLLNWVQLHVKEHAVEILPRVYRLKDETLASRWGHVRDNDILPYKSSWWRRE